jgi:hypothetical protein
MWNPPLRWVPPLPPSPPQAAITNIRVIQGDWLTVDPPPGTVALVSHVTYLTREIVPFIQKLERAGQQRILIKVNNPPPTVAAPCSLPPGAW